MINKMLLPNRYKIIGWIIFIPTAILGLFLSVTDFDGLSLNAKVFALINSEFFGKRQFFTFITTDITGTIVGILFILGALLIGFSKEKNEDEFIAKLRQSSMLWAILINYILLIFCLVFIYGSAFYSVMLYNMFTVLVIFIFRFNYVLYTSTKSMSDEKYN
ncbi:MAG: hypothetical protein ABI266_03810 [Ginsengibacter sp.]